LVLQVDKLLEQPSCCGWIILKCSVMIASDDNLVAMRQCSQKVVCSDEFLKGPHSAQIPSMNEHIPIRYNEIRVEHMGISHGDDG
jgi:hypothetical protein